MVSFQQTRDFEFDIAFSLVEQSADRVLGVMPIGSGMMNPFGTVHAGAMIWFADVAATRLARIACDAEGELGTFPLAINIQAMVLSNQRGGQITADARFLRRGKRVKVVRTLVTGDDGTLLLELTTAHIASAMKS